MEELDKLTADSLNRYFAVLESIGYTPEYNVNKLLLLQFIQEFLQEYQGYITENDYNVIEKILQCLAGTSCLIPYEEYLLIREPVSNVYGMRVTENRILRHTEANRDLRLVNQ